MNTRRVVITGMGIVSCIGNSQNEVLDSLRNGRSGISHSDDYAERGFRSHVHGKPNIDVSDHIDKKLLRFMGDGAAYNYIAMQQAIDDSGLTDEEVSNERTGLIMGSGGPSTKNMLWAWDTAREKSAKRVGPFMVPRIMSSTNSATQFCLFDQRPLHRQRRGNDSMGQAGYRLRRRRRGVGLDHDGGLRCHASAQQRL